MRHFQFRILRHQQQPRENRHATQASIHPTPIKANVSISFSATTCKACWRCIRTCPAQAIVKSSGWRNRHAVIAYPEKCTSCGACVNICPMRCFNKIEL